MLRRRMMGTRWIALVVCLLALGACDSPDKRSWNTNNYCNVSNYNPYCDLRPPQCPPCDDESLCSLPAECWTSPPDCTVCPSPVICPKPDGGLDVVGDVVRPDIPDTEPDPHLYMVECAAMTGGGLPGYLGLYGTWGEQVIFGQLNFPSATERNTKLYSANLEDRTIIEIGMVPDVEAGITEAMVIDDLSRMAYFINVRWEVPAGCTKASCRYNYGTLWGIELDTLMVRQITQEETLPLESEFCRSHHGGVSISAIDTVNQWVTVDCLLYLERGEGSGTYMVAYETYRVHLVTGELQYLTHAEEKAWVPSASPIDSGSNRYRFIWSQPWNAEMTGWEGEPFGFHVWDLQGPVPELVYERYYGRDEIASGTGVAADGWYYWNELVNGHLQIRGVDLVTGEVLTTEGTSFEKAGAHPAGRSVPHLVSFFGGTGFVGYMGMIATTREGIYLWDKERNVIRRATSNLPFIKGAFFNGAESTRWMLLTAEVGSETCLFVRDLHGAGVIDPLTNRLLPEPEEAK